MDKLFKNNWFSLPMPVLRSGWLLACIVGLSLTFCAKAGTPALTIWCLAFSGLLFMGLSSLLQRTPYQEIEPDTQFSRFIGFVAWLIWIVGLMLLYLSPFYASSLYLLLFYPLGALAGFLSCLWLNRRMQNEWRFMWIR